MSWWQAFSRPATGRAGGEDARRVDALRAAVEALSALVTALGEAVAKAAGDLEALQRQAGRLAALRADDAAAPARMRQLEGVLDEARAASHVGAAAARAPLVADPVPHLVVHGVLPDDLYRVVVAAIPAPVYFDAGGQTELPLPLTLAPVDVIAAWAFVSGIVRTAFAPAVASRFDESMRRRPGADGDPGGEEPRLLRASRGHLAVRHAGDAVPKERRRSAHVLTTVMPLVDPDNPPRADLLLQRRGSEAIAGRTTIAARPNMAVTFLALDGTLEYALDATAGSGIYTYEFPFAPGSHRRAQPSGGTLP